MCVVLARMLTVSLPMLTVNILAKTRHIFPIVGVVFCVIRLDNCVSDELDRRLFKRPSTPCMAVYDDDDVYANVVRRRCCD